MNTGLKGHITNRAKILLAALLLALLAAAAPMAADTTLHIGLAPAAMADGPQRDGGG
jgi:hypothetical protein